MAVNKDSFTKLERKELRRLAGLAYGFANWKANHGSLTYERELAKVLESLEKKFRQWREKKITAFELSDFIHQFHNGISRDLWSFYTSGHTEMIVAQAITNAIISRTEISPSILEKLK
jgi:hypothetical protein